MAVKKKDSRKRPRQAVQLNTRRRRRSAVRAARLLGKENMERLRDSGYGSATLGGRGQLGGEGLLGRLKGIVSSSSTTSTGRVALKGRSAQNLGRRTLEIARQLSRKRSTMDAAFGKGKKKTPRKAAKKVRRKKR